MHRDHAHRRRGQGALSSRVRRAGHSYRYRFSENCLNNYSDDLLVEPLTIQGGYVKVPEAPGLGIEVEEGALARYKMESPYEFPRPRLLLSVVWPGGRVMHYSSLRQCWNDCYAGNQPVQERGVRMEVHPDDGSKTWTELYKRTLRGPVRDQR